MLAIFTGVIGIVFFITIVWCEKKFNKKIKNYLYILMVILFSFLQGAVTIFCLLGKVNLLISISISIAFSIVLIISFYFHESIKILTKSSFRFPQEDLPFYPQNTLKLVKKCAYITKNEGELAFLNEYKRILESTIVADYSNYFNEQNEYLLYLISKYGVR